MKNMKPNHIPNPPPVNEAQLPQDLQALGEAVGRLPSLTPPGDLARRTLARVATEQPAAVSLEVVEAESETQDAKVLRAWWYRPITHPFARVAVAAVLFLTLSLFTNLDRAERVGILTERVLGSTNTDRLEALVDRVLLTFGPVRLSDKDMNSLIGGHGYVPEAVRKTAHHREDSTSVPRRDFVV